MTHKTANDVTIDIRNRTMRVTGGPDFAALAVAAEIAVALKLASVGFAFEGGDVTGITIDNNRSMWDAWKIDRLMLVVNVICARPATPVLT